MMSWLRRPARSAVNALKRNGLAIRPISNAPRRFAGLIVHWGEERPDTIRGAVARRQIDDKAVTFFIADQDDHIQRHHFYGEFYEQEELDVIARYFHGGVFVDIGANVGNHALYALLFLQADKVVCFEPNPPAADILDLNIVLNGLADRAVVHRVGLSDRVGHATVDALDGNLGASRLVIGEDAGGIRLMRGDDALSGEAAAFLKIDTEGLEMEVLRGLRGTIAAHRPVLFVEVEDTNAAAFEAFCADLGYEQAEHLRRYPTNANYMMVPKPA